MRINNTSDKEKKEKKKKRRKWDLESLILSIMQKSMKTALDEALSEILKTWQ